MRVELLLLLLVVVAVSAMPQGQDTDVSGEMHYTPLNVWGWVGFDPHVGRTNSATCPPNGPSHNVHVLTQIKNVNFVFEPPSPTL